MHEPFSDFYCIISGLISENCNFQHLTNDRIIMHITYTRHNVIHVGLCDFEYTAVLVTIFRLPVSASNLPKVSKGLFGNWSSDTFPDNKTTVSKHLVA